MGGRLGERRVRPDPSRASTSLVPFVVTACATRWRRVLACGPGRRPQPPSRPHTSTSSSPTQPNPARSTSRSRVDTTARRTSVHRSTLAVHEIRERHNIPVTAPVRTLLDLAACLSSVDLEAAVAEACALRLLTPNQLSRAVVAGREASGASGASSTPVPKRTRSVARAPTPGQALRAAGVDGARDQRRHRPLGGRLLLAGLVASAVEVDGYATHSSPRAFERDRRKDAELGELGLEVRRFSASQVRDELDADRRVDRAGRLSRT